MPVRKGDRYWLSTAMEGPGMAAEELRARPTPPGVKPMGNLMPLQPTGAVKQSIDLMQQIGMGGWEEFQRESQRRGRAWDIMMPGLERMSEMYGGILEGDWQDTPMGRAMQANIMRSTEGLKGRISELMHKRGMTGQPMETGMLGQAELGRGAELGRIPMAMMDKAGQFFGQTMPGVTSLAQPRQPQVQTGALQYLSQVLPYNLGIQQMTGRWEEMLGWGQGQQQGGQRFPISEIFA